MARWLIIAALAALTSGCSSIKLMYSQADYLIEGWVDKHIELNDQQQDDAYRRIDVYLEWHRTTMLPRYATYLRRIANDYQKNGNVDRPRFDARAKEAQVLWETTFRGGFGHMGKVMATLSDPQIDAFYKKLEERTEESRQRWSKPDEEKIEEGIGNTVSMLELFVGDLTEEQIKRLRERALPLYQREPLWVDNRKRRNLAVAGFLRNDPTASDAAAFLEPWLLRPWEFSPPGYREYSLSFRRDVEAVIFDVLSNLNQEQRNTLIDTMNGYAKDMAEMAS